MGQGGDRLGTGLTCRCRYQPEVVDLPTQLLHVGRKAVLQFGALCECGLGGQGVFGGGIVVSLLLLLLMLLLAALFLLDDADEVLSRLLNGVCQCMALLHQLVREEAL